MSTRKSAKISLICVICGSLSFDAFALRYPIILIGFKKKYSGDKFALPLGAKQKLIYPT
jgi:hypothetical protein